MGHIRLVATACALAFGILGSDGQGVQCDSPLGESDLKELIGAGVPTARLRQLISTCGLDLRLPEASGVEARLRELGAPASVLPALAPPPNAAAGTRWVSPFDRREMVFVPPGRFQMGSPPAQPGRDADETANDVAIVIGFWIDTTEVTNESYRRFIISRPEWQKKNSRSELHGTNYLKDWNGENYPEGMGDAPVVWIGWHAARAYAAWSGKRLPTEAEWEYAAKAGSTTSYWWGDVFQAVHVPSAANVAGASTEARTNTWGLRDATGGVWEWTLSLYRPYPYAASDGREDPRMVGPRVFRGGARANGEAFLRTANRNAEEPIVGSDLVGFRCAQ